MFQMPMIVLICTRKRYKWLMVCLLYSRLFQEHIQRLSKVVTANHKALQIPEVTICTTSQNIVRNKDRKIAFHLCVNLCRCIWRRHRGPQHRLSSGPSTPIRPHEIKYSASCACAPQLWTCSAWPMRTLYPGRTTLSLCSSLSWLKWVKRHKW